jgi:hypothetical protein
MALKRLDRGRFRIGAERLLEFLGCPFLRSRVRTADQNAVLVRQLATLAPTQASFDEFGHGLLVSDHAEGRLKLFAAIDEFF